MGIRCGFVWVLFFFGEWEFLVVFVFWGFLVVCFEGLSSLELVFKEVFILDIFDLGRN